MGSCPLKVKSAETLHPDFFEPLRRFCDLAEISPASGYVVYGGSEDQKRTNGQLVSWKNLGKVV